MSLNKKKVVVAMSGGVDSSVAALLLKEAGYEVIGITLKLWDPPEKERTRHTTCCSVEDITDARRVADQIGIPFYVLNTKEVFRKNVVDPFISEYLKGRTPNPCILCNESVKFSFLLEKAFELGAYSIATGHYVRKVWEESEERWRLLKGKDPAKDQSYFLFSLNQKQLEHLLFPVGELKKEEVRELARKAGLKTRNKSESQEICFVSNKHGDFINKHAADRLGPRGKILGENGEELGEHEGIHHYTVGQRRGTGVAEGERIYVKSINPKNHTITMGPDASLLERGLWAKGVSWIGREEDQIEVIAKIRYRHEGSPAVLHLKGGGEVYLSFQKPQRAISPGQAVVFYHNDQVLGGGWIEKGEE